MSLQLSILLLLLPVQPVSDNLNLDGTSHSLDGTFSKRMDHADDRLSESLHFTHQVCCESSLGTTLIFYKTKCTVNPCVRFLVRFGRHSFTRITTTSLNSAFTPCAPTCVNTSHFVRSQSTAVLKMKRALILQNSAKIPQHLSENSCCLKEQGMISDRRCLHQSESQGLAANNSVAEGRKKAAFVVNSHNLLFTKAWFRLYAAENSDLNMQPFTTVPALSIRKDLLYFQPAVDDLMDSYCITNSQLYMNGRIVSIAKPGFIKNNHQGAVIVSHEKSQ